MPTSYDAIVRFQYDPDPENASDDLQLTTDEIITVTEVVDDDWLFGSKLAADGTTVSGYFPKSFVEKIEGKLEPIDNPHENPSFKSEGAELSQYKPVFTQEALKQEQKQEELKQDSLNQVVDLKTIESNIIHEPENFKNKLQSFNVSSSPVMPLEKPKEESFVKKSFGGIEHRSSYIPPTFGKPDQMKKEERKPDAAKEVIRSENHVEEVEAPTMTLKERMMMLQKKQQEEQEALIAAMKRKEEKKKAKHAHDTVLPAPISKNAVETELERVPPKALLADLGTDEDLDSEDEDYENAGELHVPAVVTTTSHEDDINRCREKQESELSTEEDTKEEEEEAKEREEEEDETYSNDDDEEDEEDEEDDEEIRKRELAQRMAKLSGGMGMMGMMGMMPSHLMNNPIKKSSKRRSVVEEETVEETTKPVPILPVMGSIPPMMGMPMPGLQMHSQTKKETEEAEDEEGTFSYVQENAENVHEEMKPFTQASTIPPVPMKEDEELSENVVQIVEEATHENQETSAPQHAYRAHATSPPTVPSNFVSVPDIPTSPRRTAHQHPPPPPPVTEAPQLINENLNLFPEAPSVPADAPPAMPHTSVPSGGRPAMPPPPPPPAATRTFKEAPPPAPVDSAPPPTPGAIPTIPYPTHAAVASSTQPPLPGTVPAIPGSHPPVPSSPSAPFNDAISRQSSVSSKPPVFHAPAPPPPPATQTPTGLSEAPVPPTINRQLTRTSLESSFSLPSVTVPVPHTSQNDLWWILGILPPQIFNTDCLFEVETTDIKKRNGDVIKYLTYYILDVHLACTTLEIAYHVSEPERLLFFHESKEKIKSNPQQLIKEYASFGPHTYNAAVKLLNQNLDGDLIDHVFSAIPGPVLPPVAHKTFGAVVYRNNNGESKFYEEIRAGDILVLVNASFDSSSGLQVVGSAKPHVAVVTSFDIEKNKIKVVEQKDGSVQQARYKLNKMKSGKLRVFRVVGRSFVGW